MALLCTNNLAGTGSNLLHIIELTNPDNPTVVFTHEFNTPGDGEVTDVQVCPDTVAVSIASNTRASEGHVELYQIFYKGDPTFNLLGRLAGIIALLLLWIGSSPTKHYER